MSDTTSDPRYALMVKLANGIPGFMSDANIAVWDALLCTQQRHYTQGHLMEIGVFKGRSASVLCQHKRAEEELWLVDFSQFLAEARNNLAALTPPGVKFVHEKSSDLWRNPDVLNRQRQFRWIHVDGEHTGHAVANDLALAAQLLSNEGIICIDDFFNPAYPQISAATYMWLANHPFELELFLCGDNKAYLCRPTYAYKYLDLIRHQLAADLKARGYTTFTLYKTAPTGDANCWGIAARRGDRDHYGLDADPDVIC
jgi:predicted O-methyltransferase YrrM